MLTKKIKEQLFFRKEHLTGVFQKLCMLIEESKAPRSELMDELNWCRKDSSVIKEKHINLFERFIVYGLAKIYPIASAPECSRNLLSAQHFYLQSKDHF